MIEIILIDWNIKIWELIAGEEDYTCNVL